MIPAGGTTATDPTREGGLAARAFPALVWFLATFSLLGTLGRYTDDYALSGRDPVLGAMNWAASPFERSYFWRPLLQVSLHYGQGLLWNHWPVLHLLCALSHGLTALALFAVLRRLILSPLAAGLGALLWMVMATHYEVAFWFTAITTGIPAGLAMVLVLIMIRWARGGGRGLVVAMGVLGFVIPCWYEQPSMVVAALPLAYLAACPEGEPWRRRLTRALVPTVICGLAVVVYVALLVGTAPTTVRGGAGSFVRSAEVPGRLSEFAGQMRWMFGTIVPASVAAGFRNGWQVLGEGPIWRIALLALAALTAWPWVARGAAVAPTAPVHPVRRGVVVAMGLVVFATGWLPMIPVRGQIAETRMLYFPALGASIALAAALDGVLAALAGRRRARVAIGVGGAVCVLAGSVSLFGWQAAMRERGRTDAAQLDALRRTFPAPPPDAVFVPLDDAYRPMRTGTVADHLLVGWTGTPWSAPKALQHAYGRIDVHSTSKGNWETVRVTHVDETGFVFGGELSPKAGDAVPGGTRVPWSRAIPYMIAPDGRVLPVARIVVRRGGATVVIRPPLVAGAIVDPAAPAAIEWVVPSQMIPIEAAPAELVPAA